MKDKLKSVAGVLVLALGLYIGWPFIRWFRVRLAVRSAVSESSIGRSPTVEEIVGLQGIVEQAAKERGFEKVNVVRTVIERDVGGAIHYFLRLEVTTIEDSHSLSYERRIETTLTSSDFDELRTKGVKFLSE